MPEPYDSQPFSTGELSGLAYTLGLHLLEQPSDLPALGQLVGDATAMVEKHDYDLAQLAYEIASIEQRPRPDGLLARMADGASAMAKKANLKVQHARVLDARAETIRKLGQDVLEAQTGQYEGSEWRYARLKAVEEIRRDDDLFGRIAGP